MIPPDHAIAWGLPYLAIEKGDFLVMSNREQVIFEDFVESAGNSKLFPYSTFVVLHFIREVRTISDVAIQAFAIAWTRDKHGVLYLYLLGLRALQGDHVLTCIRSARDNEDNTYKWVEDVGYLYKPWVKKWRDDYPGLIYTQVARVARYIGRSDYRRMVFNVCDNRFQLNGFTYEVPQELTEQALKGPMDELDNPGVGKIFYVYLYAVEVQLTLDRNVRPYWDVKEFVTPESTRFRRWRKLGGLTFLEIVE